FKFLAKELQNWAGRAEPIRLWSAACSSGEEPYTLGITALEALGPGANFKILASDLSNKVLATAIKGAYDERRLAGLSMERRLRHFEKLGQGQWEVGAALRAK